MEEKQNRDRVSLVERYEEACSELRGTLAENRMLANELRYMTDFIHWKGLDMEYEKFCSEAHEDSSSDTPFPRLVL